MIKNRTISTSAILLITWVATAALVQARSFWVNFNPKIAPQDLQLYDISILSAETAVDLKSVRKNGGKYLVPINLVALGSDSGAGQEKASSSEVLEKIAKPLLDRGFDGFLLEIEPRAADGKRAQPDDEKAQKRALVDLIRKLHETFPKTELVLRGGVGLIDEVKPFVQGVLFEGFFTKTDPKGKTVAAKAEEHAATKENIRKVRAMGVPVYVVDFLENSHSALATSIANQIRELGAEPFLTTSEMQGEMLGPIRRVPRRVLVVYGSVLGETEAVEKFAEDTFASKRLQMPLEWMGYEVEYLNIGKQSPPLVLDSRFGAVVFDATLQLPFPGEAWYVDWALEQKKRGLKILITGQFPFKQDVQLVRLYKGLGIWGSYALARAPKNVTFRTVDRKLMSYEGALTVHTEELEDMRAPEDSKIGLSVTCKDAAQNEIVCDAIFSTDWGGLLLEPYATFQATAEDEASLFDPFLFLQGVFHAGDFPAPDTTTRDGQRIFFTHIDGDGFTGVSRYSGQKICGETVRDSILTKYPFPITVSLVEASVRALESLQDAKMVPHYEEVARSCLALPNVQAASHSFSHPFVWVENDTDYIHQYKTRGLELKPEANYNPDKPDLVREIKGSAEYINGLCPPGKKVELMLWSGNCRPGAEAIRICRELGLENMNGGNTVISKRHPFVSNVSPLGIPWGDELQIFAAEQNEFVFTRNWRGPFFGGFRKVIETFELTETPRRIKPVNIYYHFYSSATQGALKALTQVHDWCLAQPLHSLTAVEYTRVARDAFHTAIYEAGKREWLLVNEGNLRTYRMESRLGVPDMEKSRGITGWLVSGNQMYVHTRGDTVSRLVLTDAPRPHLHLESCQGEITWKEMSSKRVRCRIQELRPYHELVLAGAPPDSTWIVSINGREIRKSADAAGRLVIGLAKDAEVYVAPA